jgi:hypothetical protein
MLQVTIEVLVSALSLWIYVVGHVLSALNCIFAGFISCDYLLISVSESPRYSCATMEQSEHKRRYDSIQSNCKPYVTWVLCQSHTNHENANPCMITKGVYTFSQNASRWYVRTTMPFGKWYTCYHFVGIRELHRGDATILNTRLLFSVRSQDSSRVVMTYHQTRFLACGPSAPCMVTGWVKILQSSDVFNNWIRNWVVYSLKRYVKFKLLYLVIYVMVLKKYICYGYLFVYRRASLSFFSACLFRWCKMLRYNLKYENMVRHLSWKKHSHVNHMCFTCEFICFTLQSRVFHMWLS